MLALYSYPELFGVAEQQPLRPQGRRFPEARPAWRSGTSISSMRRRRRAASFPIFVDDGEHVGDSDTIIAHLVDKYRLPIDSALTETRRNTDLMIRRTLDDLYWVMSYSRWRDPQFWPLFRDAMLGAHASLTADGMEAARKFNFQRYQLSRHRPLRAGRRLQRGVADLSAVASLIGERGFMFGLQPTSIDAGVYGLRRQHLFLRYRHAAQAVRRVASPSGQALQRDP